MDSTKRTIEDLKKLRDEIRVKMHLGEMEAKEWWQGLEPQLVELEEGLERGVDKASASANVLIEEFADAYRRVRERLDQKRP